MPEHKTLFGRVLHDVLKDNGLIVRDLAAKIPGENEQTMISRVTKLKSGRWGAIPDTVLENLIDAATQDQTEQTKLMIAYLVDMTLPRFKKKVDILPHGHVAGAPSAEAMAGIESPGMRAKLEQIATAYAKNADLAKMVDTVAGWAKSVNASGG